MEGVRLGDIVQMKKKHPCGCDRWVLTRIGADVKLRCGKCGRTVMLDTDTFLKRRKAVLIPGDGVHIPEEIPGI